MLLYTIVINSLKKAWISKENQQDETEDTANLFALSIESFIELMALYLI